jgi:hypothetical protein
MSIPPIFLRVPYLATILFCVTSANVAHACREVAPLDSIRIDQGALKDLSTIRIGRDFIFEALKDTSIPETGGCWGGAEGDFDGQILSVGGKRSDRPTGVSS